MRARGRRSSKEASNTNDWISGYDITAQLAKKRKRQRNKKKKKKKKTQIRDKHKPEEGLHTIIHT